MYYQSFRSRVFELKVLLSCTIVEVMKNITNTVTLILTKIKI